VVGQTAGLGVALTIVVALLWRAVWGPSAMVAAGVFGATATVIQVVAMLVAGPKIGQGDFPGLLKRWAVGTGLRIAGVVAVVVAADRARERFQPLPTALGYLAVLVPLLFFEVRRFR
jgi:hypothetical protein